MKKSFAITILIVLSLANFKLISRAEEHTSSDPLATALEKRKILREKLKQANEEYEPMKAEVEKPDKSPSEQIEMQYKLKRLTRDMNQLKAELKENNKEIQSAQELVDIKNLAKASLEHASDFQVLLAKYKLVKDNQDVLIKVATQNALVKKGSNSGLFFDPKYVIDSVPGSYELEDKSTLALLDSIEKNKEMALTYSLMKNHVKQVAVLSEILCD